MKRDYLADKTDSDADSGILGKNPGLTRIMTGHALMFEQDKLQSRINQLYERIEAQLRQVLKKSGSVTAAVLLMTKAC